MLSHFCSRYARTISLLVTFVNNYLKSWAQAVRTNSTILVLHSGNHEIIGIRHRKSQTLYISNVIEPHAASPAYGKIHVGLYIAALWDVMDRIQQDLQAEKENGKNAPSDPPSDGGGEGEDKDEDEDDHRSKKRPRTTHPTPHLKSTTRGKRSEKSGAKSGGRTAGGMTDQVRSDLFFPPKRNLFIISPGCSPYGFESRSSSGSSVLWNISISWPSHLRAQRGGAGGGQCAGGKSQ